VCDSIVCDCNVCDSTVCDNSVCDRTVWQYYVTITRKADGNFGNVSAGVWFSKVAYQRKRW